MLRETTRKLLDKITAPILEQIWRRASNENTGQGLVYWKWRQYTNEPGMARATIARQSHRELGLGDLAVVAGRKIRGTDERPYALFEALMGDREWVGQHANTLKRTSYAYNCKRVADGDIPLVRAIREMYESAA